ncbi:MAG: biotin/lipoyl-containing protein, partial [Chloroflexota bacterium]
MPYSFILPPLAETTAEGTVGRWQKQPGDRVKRYEPLVDIMTDKVNVEMTSPVTGVISEINAPEGVVVPVGGVLATIIEDDEGSTPAAAHGAPAGVLAAPVAAPTPPAPTRGEGRQRMTPVVARLALEHAVDVSRITGSGIEGRVTKQDILDFVERGAAQPTRMVTPTAAPPPAVLPPPRVSMPPVAPGADEEAIPLSPVRRAIAEHMSNSKATIPHAWTMVEVDVTPLVRLRERLKDDFRKR